MNGIATNPPQAGEARTKQGVNLARRRGDKLCLRLRRNEQAVGSPGGNSRPVGKPGDRPGPRGHPPRGAKAAPWDTQVSPQVCGIAIRGIPRVAVTGQHAEETEEKAERGGLAPR